MRFVNGFFALWWIASCIGLFFGYEPHKFTIGIAFLLSAELFSFFFFEKIH